MRAHYEQLADELIRTQMDLLRIPARRQMTKLNRGEQSVLQYLLVHESPAHPGDLSRSLEVSTARVAALLGVMEEKGLIARSADPEDSRQVIVTLLPAGVQAIRAIRAQVRDAVVRLLEQLGPEDAAEYLRIQKRIVSFASKDR
jgi:DNA-binding MarR family transcriptional regulator